MLTHVIPPEKDAKFTRVLLAHKIFSTGLLEPMQLLQVQREFSVSRVLMTARKMSLHFLYNFQAERLSIFLFWGISVRFAIVLYQPKVLNYQVLYVQMRRQPSQK
jgi:hypothetical protein